MKKGLLFALGILMLIGMIPYYKICFEMMAEPLLYGISGFVYAIFSSVLNDMTGWVAFPFILTGVYVVFFAIYFLLWAAVIYIVKVCLCARKYS